MGRSRPQPVRADRGRFASAGRSERGWMRDSVEALKSLDIAHEVLDREAMERRFPLVHLRDGDRALLQPAGGVLLANSIIEELARYLAAHSVPIRTKSKATAIDPNRGTVRLADGRAIEADRLVVAAGPWVGRLLTGHGAPGDAVAATGRPYGAAGGSDPGLEPHADGAGTPIPPTVFYLVPPVGGTRMKIGDSAFSLTGGSRPGSSGDRGGGRALVGKAARTA